VTPYLGVKVTGSRADGCEMELSCVVSELERGRRNGVETLSGLSWRWRRCIIGECRVFGHRLHES